MKLRQFFAGHFLLSFLLILPSCSDDSPTGNINTPVEPDRNFKYPYALNSFWYYSTYNYVTNFRPDSLRNIFDDDTLVGNGIARFSSDTVINTDTFRILRNTHASSGHDHTTIELFKQSDTGLVRHAYYSSGTNFGPFRPGDVLLKNLNDNRSFNSPYQMTEWYSAYEENSYSGDTTLIFDDPPVRALRYPIDEGTEWNYLDYGQTKIKKQYSGFENVTTAAGTFFCSRVKRNWYFNFASSPDTNFILVDYFSKSGMVKRDFRIKNVIVTNSNGEPLGHIDVVEESKLNIVTLP